VWLAGHVSAVRDIEGKVFCAGLRFSFPASAKQENTTVGHAAGAKRTLP
jgi:hypothetical protein